MGGRRVGEMGDEEDSGSAMDDGTDVFFDAEEGWVSVSSDADSDRGSTWRRPHHPHHEDDDDDDDSHDNNSAMAGTNDDSIDGRDGMGTTSRFANMSIDVSRTASTTSNIRLVRCGVVSCGADQPTMNKSSTLPFTLLRFPFLTPTSLPSSSSSILTLLLYPPPQLWQQARCWQWPSFQPLPALPARPTSVRSTQSFSPRTGNRARVRASTRTRARPPHRPSG